MRSFLNVCEHFPFRLQRLALSPVWQCQTRTSVQAATFLPTFYVTFINIHSIQFAIRKRMRKNSMQHMQLHNLTKVLLFKYEMGSNM